MAQQTMTQKTIASIGCLTILMLFYQNCTTSHLSASTRIPSSSAQIHIEVLDPKTLTVVLDEDLSKLSTSDIQFKGKYSYPTLSKNTLHEVRLQDLNKHYSCTDSPQRCEITFKIPDQMPEMDLSKIYSYKPYLSLVVTNTKNNLEKTFQVYIDRGMLKETSTPEIH